MKRIFDYKNLAEEIPIATEHVIKMGMYEMHREDLIEVLVMAAEGLKRRLIDYCLQLYQNRCKM